MSTIKRRQGSCASKVSASALPERDLEGVLGSRRRRPPGEVRAGAARRIVLTMLQAAGSFGALLDDKASAEALNEMTFGLPLAIGGQRADRRQRHQRHPDPGVQHLGDMARWW